MNTATANPIIRTAAHQTITGTDHTNRWCGGVDPGYCAGAAVPRGSCNVVFGTRKRVDAAIADAFVAGRAHQAVGGGYRARNSRRAVRPRNRAGRTIPVWAVYGKFAAGQSLDATAANLVACGCAHQAVGRGNTTGNPGRRVECCQGPCRATPKWAANQEIARAQKSGDVAASNLVVNRTSTQVGQQRTGSAVKQIDGASVGGREVIGGLEHQDVAGWAQYLHALAKTIVAAWIGIQQLDIDTRRHYRRLDPDVFRVKQEAAVFAVCGAGVGQAAKLRLRLARYLDKTAVAALSSPTRCQVAGKPVGSFGPYDHIATVAIHPRARLEMASTGGDHIPSIWHAAVLAIPSATNAHGASAGVPVRDQVRSSKRKFPPADRDSPTDPAGGACIHGGRCKKISGPICVGIHGHRYVATSQNSFCRHDGAGALDQPAPRFQRDRAGQGIAAIGLDRPVLHQLGGLQFDVSATATVD